MYAKPDVVYRWFRAGAVCESFFSEVLNLDVGDPRLSGFSPIFSGTSIELFQNKNFLEILLISGNAGPDSKLLCLRCDVAGTGSTMSDSLRIPNQPPRIAREN